MTAGLRNDHVAEGHVVVVPASKGGGCLVAVAPAWKGGSGAAGLTLVGI